MTKKSKPIIKFGFTSAVSIIGAVFIFAVLLKNSALASNEVKNALKICANMLIPSLFPLTVASEIMTNTGAIEKLTRKFSGAVAKILGVSKNATTPYFLGLFGGYTSSCKSAVLLYQSGKITRQDCESIIAMSNMPSLAFMTGFVGIGIFENSTYGWVLWIIAVLSTLILGTINRLFFKKEKPYYKIATVTQSSKNSFSKIFVGALTHSAYAMLIICACVVFFSVMIAVLSLSLKDIPLPDSIKNTLLGSLEITQGINSCANIKGLSPKMLSCAYLVGWSGLCVHFQVIALCEDADLSFRKYFVFKILQGVVCTLLALAFLSFKP